MNCKKVLSRLQAYVDGEVPEKLRGGIEKHLDACPACRSQVESARQLAGLLDALPVPPLPQGFAARVMAEAKRKTPIANKRTPFSPREWPSTQWLHELSASMRAAVCAAALVACLLGMFMSKEFAFDAHRPASVGEPENLAGFEWFSPTPPASLGSIYLSYVSAMPANGEGP